MVTVLPQLLDGAAVRHPGRPAVVDGNRTITYRELAGWSDRLADRLRGLGVANGDRVGLYLEKSAEAVAALYAVMKAGATYVPLDPNAPPARLGYIAGNCGIHCLISGGRQRESWDRLVEAGAPLEAVVAMDADSGLHDAAGVAEIQRYRSTATREPAALPPRAPISLDLAYLLYTSGSTGEPKGVMLTHLNALAFVEWAFRRFEVGSEDRLSSHAPLHFDLSVFDLFAAAAGGAAVVLVPEELSLFPPRLASFIDEQAISIWYSVPSILSMLAMRGGLADRRLPSLRTILFAGEVFPVKYLRRLMDHLPHVAFFNLYGPTETNVCTYQEVAPLADDQVEPIPIGRAIDDVEVFAVTDSGERAGPGEVGELWVRGATVMRGYWGDPERTQQVLRDDVAGSGHGDLAYRTGDLVQEADDGAYRFLGRRDAQIKSRGYRIELGEIESALYAHPAVAECAVVAVPDDLVTNRIVAFLATREPVAPADLARSCGARIPKYMVPEHFELMDELPKTSTGKLDRSHLAELGKRIQGRST